MPQLWLENDYNCRFHFVLLDCFAYHFLLIFIYICDKIEIFFNELITYKNMSNNLQQIITEMQILIGSKTRFIAVDISKYLDEEYLKKILKSMKFSENDTIYEMYPQIVQISNSIISYIYSNNLQK